MAIVGSEVCEVFYRDIIDCIKSLFGNPNFMLYLCFAPEKHYTNNTKDVQMYHDMHTCYVTAGTFARRGLSFNSKDTKESFGVSRF